MQLTWKPLAAAALVAWLSAEPLTGQDDQAKPQPVSLQDLASNPPGTFEKPVANPRNKMPTYTAEAGKACVRGVVSLKMVINERGRVENIRVVKPLSHGLTEKAVKAAKRFRYKPAKVNGKPIAFMNFQTFTFEPPLHCRDLPRYSRPIDADPPPPTSRSPRPPGNR